MNMEATADIGWEILEEVEDDGMEFLENIGIIPKENEIDALLKRIFSRLYLMNPPAYIGVETLEKVEDNGMNSKEAEIAARFLDVHPSPTYIGVETLEKVDDNVTNPKEAEIAARFLDLHPTNPDVNVWLGERAHRSGIRFRYHNGNRNHIKKLPERISESRKEISPWQKFKTHLSNVSNLAFAVAVLICWIMFAFFVVASSTGFFAGGFHGCVDRWCLQSGLSKPQYTKCESVKSYGMTCVNPEIKYGSTSGGIPSLAIYESFEINGYTHTPRQGYYDTYDMGPSGISVYDAWCQQLGGTYKTHTIGTRTGYCVRYDTGYDEPYSQSQGHWSDCRYGYWYNQALKHYQKRSDYITSITCEF